MRSIAALISTMTSHRQSPRLPTEHASLRYSRSLELPMPQTTRLPTSDDRSWAQDRLRSKALHRVS
ncbi:hypothetical protein DEI91_15820 [Curtobacterium sp. MCBD17_032]|nr:hypothetical protein DEI91_15820 [Curtobacterium sp. MCBD17_032]